MYTMHCYIEQRSGLLAPDDKHSYVFVHLTLQEHCAGRHMLLGRGAATQVAQHRTEDRWREPILLGLGVAQQSRPQLIERVLADLIDRKENGQFKDAERWYRDLIFATEIGKDRDWDYLRTQDVAVDRLQEGLKQGLITLLHDKSQPFLVNKRMQAGELLNALGDPRFPVSLDEWRSELSIRNQDFGTPAGYWCYVRPGTYEIGGWERGQDAAKIALSAFWIARYQITVAQFEQFVKEGYGPDAERWWTPNGWQWRQDEKHTEPEYWKQAPYDRSNQPVIDITWYEASAFCAWLNELFGAELPQGYCLRLPTEAEREAAAAYDQDMQRRPFPWGMHEPTPELAIYDASNLRYPAPVGTCPAGAAACSALDMAGNVWELMTSSYTDYPTQSQVVMQDFAPEAKDIPWHGGSYYNTSEYLFCGMRDNNRTSIIFSSGGFRVVLAPKQSE